MIQQTNWLDALLPCPYCRSAPCEPNFSEYIGDTRWPQWEISCSRCPATMAVDGESPAGVIDAWNKRS